VVIFIYQRSLRPKSARRRSEARHGRDHRLERNGPIGTVRLAFQMFAKFADMARDVRYVS
jgi:replicative DNA helicase